MNKKIIISIILGILVFLGLIHYFYDINNHKDNINKCITKQSIITDLNQIDGCIPNKYSISDSYYLSQEGVYLLSGSTWRNGDKFSSSIAFMTGDTMSTYILQRFLGDVDLIDPIILYDETEGSKAGILVYLLRSLGKMDSYLYVGNNLNESLVRDKSIDIEVNLYDVTNDKYIKQYPNGYFGEGKYRVVFNPFLATYTDKDLFLYSCDEGRMKEDPFYQKNAENIASNFKVLKWSRLFDINRNLKSKNEISKMLGDNGINLLNYNNVYIFYPGEWRKSGVEALILDEYYSNNK